MTHGRPDAPDAATGTAAGGRQPAHRGAWPRQRVAIALFLAPALVLFVLLVLAPIAARRATPACSSGTASACRPTSSGWTTSPGFWTTRSSSATCERGADPDRPVAGDPAAGVAGAWPCCSTSRCAAAPSTGCCSSRRTCCPRSSPACCSRMVFSPNQGLANQLAGWLGLGDLGGSWLADPRHVLYALFFVITWKYFGFHMILYLAGRQSIPHGARPRPPPSTAPAPGRCSGTSRCRCSARRSGSASSCRSSARSSSSTWSGCSPAAARSTRRRRWPSRCSSTASAASRSATPARSAWSMFLISLVFALLYQRFVLRRDTRGRADHDGRPAMTHRPRRRRPVRERRAAPAPVAARCTSSHRRSARSSWCRSRSACSAASRTTASCPPTRSGCPTRGCPSNYTEHPGLRRLLAAAGQQHAHRAGHRRCWWWARRRDGRVRLRPLRLPRPRAAVHPVRDRADVPVRGGDPAAVHPAARAWTCSTTRSA